MPTGSDLAKLAESLLAEGKIKYQEGGRTYPSFDCGTFVEHCLKKLGVQISANGVNDLYRKVGSGRVPLSQAHAQGIVVPGALIFHVTDKNDLKNKDGLGYADYVVICINSTTAVTVSENKKGIIPTVVDKKPVPGRANTVVLCQGLDYSPAAQLSVAAPLIAVVTGNDVRLRASPKTGETLVYMSKGTECPVHTRDNGDGWCEMTCGKKRGWCSLEYLNFRG